MVPMKAGAAPQATRVAQVTQVAREPSPAPDAAPAANAAVLRLYTVRPGDTLYGIALRHRTAVDTLLHLNRLTASVKLQPGLKLRLP
jgi:LysM repeat protein